MLLFFAKSTSLCLKRASQKIDQRGIQPHKILSAALGDVLALDLFPLNITLPFPTSVKGTSPIFGHQAHHRAGRQTVECIDDCR